MRHNIFGRQLSRTKNERRRLFQGLVRDLIMHGTIKTSLAKAKAVQPLVETLITKAKDGSDVAFRRIDRVIADKAITRQLTDEGKTRFGNRTSGFTRIIKTGSRVGDASEEVLLQFVDERVVVEVAKPTDKQKPEKKEKATVEKKKVTKPKVRKPRVKK